MMNKQPPELKNQGISYNKMGHLNLLSDQDVHAMFTYRKGKGMFKKHLQILLVSKSQYLKQQGTH